MLSLVGSPRSPPPPCRYGSQPSRDLMRHAQSIEDALFTSSHSKQVRREHECRPAAGGGQCGACAALACLCTPASSPCLQGNCLPPLQPPTLPIGHPHPCPRPQVYLSKVSNAVRLARTAPDVADIPRIASGEPREVAEGGWNERQGGGRCTLDVVVCVMEAEGGKGPTVKCAGRAAAARSCTTARRSAHLQRPPCHPWCPPPSPPGGCRAHRGGGGALCRRPHWLRHQAPDVATGWVDVGAGGRSSRAAGGGGGRSRCSAAPNCYAPAPPKNLSRAALLCSALRPKRPHTAASLQHARLLPRRVHRPVVHIARCPSLAVAYHMACHCAVHLYNTHVTSMRALPLESTPAALAAARASKGSGAPRLTFQPKSVRADVLGGQSR